MAARTNTTTTNPTPLDLDNGQITYEQMAAVITALYQHMSGMVRRKSWCSGWRDYARTLDPDMTGETVTDVPSADIDPAWLNDTGKAALAGRAIDQRRARLRDIRGRVLHYVRHGEITLAEANEAFTAVGLPVHTVETPESATAYLYLPTVWLRGTEEQFADHAAVRRSVADAMVTAFAAAGFPLDTEHRRNEIRDAAALARYIEGPLIADHPVEVPSEVTVRPLRVS